MSEQEKVAEGHKYLTEEDLDPDAQESEDTETPPEKDTETPKEESDAEKPKEDTSQEEVPPAREYKGIKVGEKVYQDEASLVAAYQSAEGVIGRQGNEIGQLNTKIATLEKEIPQSKDDPEPEHDSLDEVKTRAWNEWNKREIKREIFTELRKVEDEKQDKENLASQVAIQDEIHKFLEENQSLSVGQLLKINRMVGEDGLSYAQALSKVGNGQPKEKPDATTRKKQEAAEDENQNLSGGGGAAKVGVDLDALSPEQWGEQKKTMTKAEIATFLNQD